VCCLSLGGETGFGGGCGGGGEGSRNAAGPSWRLTQRTKALALPRSLSLICVVNNFCRSVRGRAGRWRTSWELLRHAADREGGDANERARPPKPRHLLSSYVVFVVVNVAATSTVLPSRSSSQVLLFCLPPINARSREALLSDSLYERERARLGLQ